MRDFIDRLRNSIFRFMCGRNGVDQFSNFLIIISFIFLVPTLFISGSIRWIFIILFWATVIYSYFRIFSKNVYKRQKENNWFLTKTKYYKTVITESKNYRFYTCPKCHTHLRVPRGVGNITITCKNCGYEFDKKA